MARKAKRRMGGGFKKGQCNTFCQTIKASAGKSCNRKAMLRAVKNGASPSQAVSQHCRSKR